MNEGNDEELGRWMAEIKKINPGGHRENCAECAVLVDKMLQGLNFRAASQGQVLALRTLERLFGRESEPHLYLSEIEEAMRIAGEGTRVILHGFPTKPEEGHFVNAINHRGVIRYLDGQIGSEADLSWFVDGEITMLRTH